jgi:hypothetical protein
VERCRVWQLDAFGRSERTGDAALQTYVVALVVEVWHPLSRLLKPWRRWSPWLKLPRWVKLESLPKNGRLPPGCGFWHVGYSSRRGPRRSRHHRRVRGYPPLAG